MAAALIAPHLPGCAYASALCIVINGIARTPKRSRRLISGTPLYLYQVALAFQILVYPALTLSAWSASRGGRSWWRTRSRRRRVTTSTWSRGECGDDRVA